MGKYEGVMNDYANTKKLLELEGFDVKHLFTDTRDDSGDDGGYLIAISEKKGKIYLQIVDINYNGQVDFHVLDEEMLEQKGGVADYIVFDSIISIQEFLVEFVRVMNLLVEAQENDEDFYGESPEEFEDALRAVWPTLQFQYYLNGTDEEQIFMIAEFMYKCYFPFSEYSKQDSQGILTMTDKPYEFIEEEDENEFDY